MIKKYNQFVNKRLNEGVYDESDESIEDTLYTEKDGEEEKDVDNGDFFTSKLKELADKLDTDVVDGKITYDDNTIIFPSETNMYHVDNRKFKTSDEVVSFLQRKGDNTNESKSYRNTRRFKK